MRMPISFVRRETLHDIRPKSPIDAISIARRAEHRVGLREDPLLREPLLHLLDLRGDVHQRQIGIDLPDRFANRADHRRRDRRRFEPGKSPWPGRFCRCGTYIVGGGGSRTLVVLRVAQDADDLDLVAGFEARPDALADRILVREDTSERPRR